MACQPPEISEAIAVDSKDGEDTSFIINEDSVILAPEYILSIKSSRYQPSLGVQGVIEPIQQTQITAAKNLYIEKILVKKGQWVEKGAPLLIVQSQNKTSDSRIIGSHKETPDQTGEDSLSEPLIDIKSNSNTMPDNSNDDSGEANESVKADNNHVQSSAISTAKVQPIVIRASFSGRIDNLYIVDGQTIASHKPLLHLSDDTDLRFTATLPIQAESQLSVGQTVNFTADGHLDKFTGQVSQVTKSDKMNELLVYVHVVKNDVSRGKLHLNTAVSGRVDYGQIKVGTIVPEYGIHDADLTDLKKPPYQPISPLTANIWIINQNQRLTRQTVNVIEYDPITNQYLVEGISNDSLICLADLPLDSAGKKVIVS